MARALALAPDHRDARWLFAASRDRYLHQSDRPQIYGTQSHCDADSRRRYWTLDPLRSPTTSALAWASPQ